MKVLLTLLLSSIFASTVFAGPGKVVDQGKDMINSANASLKKITGKVDKAMGEDNSHSKVTEHTEHTEDPSNTSNSTTQGRKW